MKPSIVAVERGVRSGLSVVLMGPVILLSVPAQAAGQIAVTYSSSLPAGRTNTPVPGDRNVVFYIQRSINRNTVVYQARLDGNGKLAARAPIAAFWRRFAGRGNKRALKFIERTMAYGVSAAEISPGRYSVKFAAYSKRRPVLRLDRNGRPMLTARVGGQEYKLIFAYVHLRSAGFIPDIAYIDLVGQNLATGRYARARVHEPMKLRGRKLGLH